MEPEIPPRNLIRVERGVEEALRNFTGVETNGSELPEITVAERIDKIGNISALAIGEASEMTARDIEEAGQAAVDIAAEIMKEAQQLAAELRPSGQKMSEHLTRPRSKAACQPLAPGLTCERRGRVRP
jgi:hypothetical protein